VSLRPNLSKFSNFSRGTFENGTSEAQTSAWAECPPGLLSQQAPGTCTPAKIAKVAKVRPSEPSSLAGQEGENGVSGTSANASVAWREALLGLSPDRDPCPGFRPGAWARVWSNALDFIDRHGAEAHRLGWTAVELFGVHPALGVIRVDHAGALMLAVAGRGLAVEAGLIRHANGLALRRSFGSVASVLVWNFGRADAIHLRR
jgi:hypothetical protein